VCSLKLLLSLALRSAEMENTDRSTYHRYPLWDGMNHALVVLLSPMIRGWALENTWSESPDFYLANFQ